MAKQEVLMKYIARFALPVLVASVGALLVPQNSSAQNDPLIGIWKVNVAKSKYAPNSTFAPVTYRIIQASGQGLMEAFSGETASGPFLTVNTIVCDGKQHPRLGAGVNGGTVNATMCRRPDLYTREFVNIQNGKQGTPGTMVVSRDGSTLTVSFGSDYVAVFDRVGPAAKETK
jgi:hypothetical protein